jgi:hypothetical protein
MSGIYRKHQLKKQNWINTEGQRRAPTQNNIMQVHEESDLDNMSPRDKSGLEDEKQDLYDEKLDFYGRATPNFIRKFEVAEEVKF